MKPARALRGGIRRVRLDGRETSVGEMPMVVEYGGTTDRIETVDD